jgi:GcrA cell cycle regulator
VGALNGSATARIVPMSDTGWTDSRVESLKSLWLEGLSASQVAKQLGGVTRNAVIGKIHRLGLSGRAAGENAAPRVRAARTARQAARPSVRLAVSPCERTRREPVVLQSEGPGRVSSMAGLHGHICKWPIGDPQGAVFSFCGPDAPGDGPYCGDHHRRAHQPRKAIPLDRDPVVRRVLAGLAA